MSNKSGVNRFIGFFVSAGIFPTGRTLSAAIHQVGRSLYKVGQSLSKTGQSPCDVGQSIQIVGQSLQCFIGRITKPPNKFYFARRFLIS